MSIYDFNNDLYLSKKVISLFTNILYSTENQK